MITSVNNGQVKNIIQLNQKTKARREQGLFVAEGRKMFGEAPRDWFQRCMYQKLSAVMQN